MQNPLAKLIVAALKRAEGHPIPEDSLRTQLTSAVAPPAEIEDFDNAFLLLLKRDYVKFKKDGLSDERKFSLTGKGEAYAG